MKEKEKEKEKEKNTQEVQQLDPFIQQMEMKYKKQLELVKNMNGITEKNMRNIDKITKIELVLEQFPNMDILQIFNNLQELTLINVEIETITGLDDLYNLRDLWLSENQIRKIENISNCQQLRKLYLCNNKIENIQNLESLYNLEILWMNNNKIKELKNLDNLQNLQQLWMCSNQIECVKTSLDNLKILNDLNLSGNKICSFKEALNLNRLGALRIVAFQDPNYGDNPICNLCNYQTYILYHLRQINRLDTLFISEEAKSFADATFMKKKMYYNMRIKTLQRTFSTIRKIMQKAFDRKLSFLDQDITYLHMVDFELKSTEKQGEDHEYVVNEIQQRIQESHEQVSHLEQIYQNYLHQMQVFSKQCTNKLITELETGGNIRLEEGRGTEKWYQSCIDLIKSRLFPEQMEAKYNVNDILVKRVIRIHNRFLKNKFEEKSELLQDQMKTNYKKSLEFLFYGIDPAKSQNELVQIIEEGFQQEDKAKQGVCPYPALTNSILACDAHRIRQSLANNQEIIENLPNYLKGRIDSEKISQQFIGPGVILICKVLIFKSVEDAEQMTFDPEQSINKNYNQHPLNRKEYSQESSVFRTFNNDQKHKLWFILDNNLVLPEYMVEFEYQSGKQEEKDNLIKVGDTLCQLDPSGDADSCFITPNNFDKLKDSLDVLFNQAVQQIIDPENELNKYDQLFNVNLELSSKDLDRSELFMIKPNISNFFRMCLNHSPPQLGQPMDLPQYDFDLLLSDSLQLNRLLQINMSNQNISALKQSVFAKCDILESLNLSFNFICDLQPITVCSKLQFLDVSYNQISQLDHLGQSQCLIFLNLNCNQIYDLEEFLKIKHMNLLFLNVRCNQFKDNSAVFKFAVQHLQNVQYLNNLKIGTTEYKRIEEHNFIEIDEDIIFQNAKFFNGYDSSIEDLYDKNNQWQNNVEILVLSHYKVQMINRLSSLTKLRQLYLDSNCISVLQGLDTLTLLEELILTNNQITSIDNLHNNIYLKKLELGNNNIQVIEKLDTLKNLMQISLEDNQITSLANFPDLPNLMEMYLANNRIPTSREVLNIKHLNKLIILDMCGNPLTKDPNYRIYSLYHLKKLKVLDGIAVELNEQQMAKDLFTGRLTEELLLQRLNGVSPQKIAELDLSDCQLRDFEDVFNSSYFPQLQELNLSQNLFISTGMIGELDSLKILILNSNKIETLAYNMDISLKKGLNGVQNLEILDVSYNNIRDFNGLQFCNLKELKILKADNNEIFRIDCLENLKTLKELDVCRNRIRQFDGTSFINCNPIKCLKIEENSLKNFHHIQKLYKLQHLFAINNKINDIPDVERLCELPYLKELELAGNPISRRNGYKIAIIKKLPQLIYLDGKEITIDEKEKYEVMTPQIQNNEKIQYPQYLMNQNNYQNSNSNTNNINNNNNNNNNNNPNNINNLNNNKHYKINPVNFDGVFGNVRLPQDNFTHTNYINYSKNNYK